MTAFITTVYHPNLKPGSKCPMLISYDVVKGSVYCRRVLKEAKNSEVKK
jgi:hypothetical protein